ncbi:hypothetical protein A2U01_0022998, partial [Trifolium medium]|nr:hypothetical protein [Trifolium medium]
AEITDIKHTGIALTVFCCGRYRGFDAEFPFYPFNILQSLQVVKLDTLNSADPALT